MNSNCKQVCSAAAKDQPPTFLAILLVAALSTLTACGGGKSSTTTTDNNAPSPVAGSINGGILVPVTSGQAPLPASEVALLPEILLGQRQFADPNVLLNLRAVVIAAKDATISKTLWTQVSGPLVRIPSPTQLDNVVLMPDVNVATQLEFRLTAEDNKGRVNSATTSILIKPVPTFVNVIGGVFNESDEQVVFKVRLNAPSTSPITVTYLTQKGTANLESETDYANTLGSITFAVGEVVKEIAIPLINDTTEEADESFSLQAIAIDGTAVHANNGVAIIHNGVEPQLQQAMQFVTPGPAAIDLKSQYANPVELSTGAAGTGKVIYVSSNPQVATVDTNGLVMPLTLGTTTITAIKYADDIYLSAEVSYALQVVNRGAVPVVNLEGESDAFDGTSAQLGQTMGFAGWVTDQEDGPLPTAAQLSENQATGKPITSLSWNSSIDGFLGYGSYIEIANLAQGTHEITYSATDSDGNTGIAGFRALVGNIAPLAFASASSTYCSSITDGLNCYYAFRINDARLSTTLGGNESWVNDNTVKLPQWVALDWSQQGYVATINTVDLYLTEEYILRDYDIEYWDGNNWMIAVSVTNNAELHPSHPISTITTTAVRVNAKKGSISQSQYARVNELVVFGTLRTP